MISFDMKIFILGRPEGIDGFIEMTKLCGDLEKSNVSSFSNTLVNRS
jgi:hypothetical protein